MSGTRGLPPMHVKNKFRSKLKQKKKESWGNYIKTLNPKTPIKQVYNVIKTLKNHMESKKENRICDKNR